MAISVVEQAKDGRPPKVFTLTNQLGMQVSFMDVGATWLSCQIPVNGALREVLLGVDSIKKFEQQQVFLGTTVGRYANRIANGQFEVDGSAYQVETNQVGHCLHGGIEGFDKRRWQVVHQTARSIEFCLTSPDGDQGFPGTLIVKVCYSLSDDNSVTIDYIANTDKATPVNLTNHAYFNLMDANSNFDVRQHKLQVEARGYLPTTELGIPLGEVEAVNGTDFDFSVAKPIAQDFLSSDQQKQAKGYDHCFVLNEHRDKTQPIAELISPDGEVKMFVTTTKPGIQVYTGNYLAGTPSRREEEYSDFSGVALETQFFPDAPNHPEWEQSSSILEPDQSYHHSTCYQFSC